LAVGIWIGIALADQIALKVLFFLPILFLLRKSSLAPVLLATFTGALTLLIHLQALHTNQIKEFFGEHTKVLGVVSTDPNATRAKVIGSRLSTSKITFLMRVEAVSNTHLESRIRIPIRVVVEESPHLIPGQRIELSGNLVRTKERKVAALLIAEPDSIILREAPGSLLALEKVREALRSEVIDMGGDSAALIPGMVIGDTSQQSQALTKVMLEAGLSHLTAVSGANFAIVSAFLFAALGFVIRNRRVQVVVTVFALIIFVLLVRPTPSVLRAGLMAAVFLVAKLSGSRNAGVNSLATAISLLLLINPFQAFEAGFILSVLATTGLLFLAPQISARVPGPKLVGELISIPTAATIFCAPYLLAISDGMNTGAIILNILVAPVVPIVTILGFIATLLILPIREIARPILDVADLGTSWIVYIASWSDSTPSLISNPLIILLLFITIPIYRYLGRKVAYFYLALLLTFGTSDRLLFPGNDWKVGQCDVGQGDALLVNLGSGSAMLFDAGPDPRLLERCLEVFKIKRLPLIVVSHAHADHYEGIAGIGSRDVGELWSTREFDLLENVQNRIVRKGEKFQIGDSKVEIIWPSTGMETFESVAGDGSTENNRSVVAVVEIADLKILITGDIEPGAQQEIAKDLAEIDVIKVPHHGSRFQEPSLFEGASIFLISVGKNSYGHPDQGLISMLSNVGRVFRSDRDGAISLGWHLDDSGEPIFSARLLRKDWWRISWH
jgi:competence protein ComEC